MTTVEILTLAIALLGAGLGIINTWGRLSEKRVRLRVIPKTIRTSGEHNLELSAKLETEVINLSTFPVSISEAGLFVRGMKGGMNMGANPEFDGRLPVRLEPRSAVTLVSWLYGEVTNSRNTAHNLAGKKIKSVYVETDCGVLAKGSSPALQRLRLDKRD